MKLRMQDSDLVAIAWSKMTIVPELTEIEAVRATQRLWRMTFGGTSPTVETGRTTVVITATAHITVRLKDGWPGLLHELALQFEPYEKLRYIRDTAAQLELRFVHTAFKRGWLRGTLRPPAERQLSTREKQQQAYASIVRRIESWSKKEQRAHKAIVKLTKKRRYYEKILKTAS